MRRRIGLIFLAGLGPLFLVGLIGIVSLQRQVRTNPRTSVTAEEVLAAEVPPPTVEGAVSGKPVRIQVPSVGIDVQVANGYYYPKSGTWTLSTDKAHYATMTKPTNDREGNTFIYGHNLAQVFKPLAKVKDGDIAIVQTDNGRTFTYRYSYTHITSPKDVSLFNYEGKPMLTLQTCSGLWDQDRRLLWFDLAGVQ